ncbi:MAG: site-specific DNA-methyltransferase [Christensenella sp.]|nr:MAG: site-specific DNA-methyltransferase [Christensenella sp.]
MPTLEWIGKDKVINHHQEVPFRILDKKYSYNAESSENMIIHGDNLLALKSLLPQYEGKVDCIYIDPPYNTAHSTNNNQRWVYNDNVDDPHIKNWLGEVVGDEGEDLSRHDKWLCMMYPRLKLLQKLLSPYGRIFISIDENELYNLKKICDEIFGPNCFVGQYMWYKSATPPNLSYKIKRNLEYVLCYEKEKNSLKFSGVQKNSSSDDPFTKPQNSYKILTFPVGSIHYKGNDGTIKAGIYGTAKFPNKLLDDLVIENGVNTNAVRFENRFIWVQETLEENIRNNTRINLSKQLVLSYKRANYDAEVPPNLIDDTVGVSTTEEAGKEQIAIFGKKVFDYPKDKSLIEYLIQFVDKNDAIILDSFAGSGTTAHAVLDLNKQDGGNRKFILVEMMDYADTITAERVKRVIDGYGEGNKAVAGLGGNFSYYELGEPLFKEDKNLNEEVGEDAIRKYVYYMETKRPLEVGADDNRYYMGKANDTAYYFYYEKNKPTTLNREFLSTVKTKASGYLIYADVCALPKETLDKNGIVFKKIPRDIKKL